jgi:hypothetical protein
MEPLHHSSSKYESIQGIYTSNELAVAKIDELYASYFEAYLDHHEINKNYVSCNSYISYYMVCNRTYWVFII